MNAFLFTLIFNMHLILSFIAISFLLLGIRRGVVLNIIAAILLVAAVFWKIGFLYLGTTWRDCVFIAGQAVGIFCNGMIVGIKVQGKNDRKFYSEEIRKLLNVLHAKESHANSVIQETDEK